MPTPDQIEAEELRNRLDYISKASSLPATKDAASVLQLVRESGVAFHRYVTDTDLTAKLTAVIRSRPDLFETLSAEQQKLAEGAAFNAWLATKDFPSSMRGGLRAELFRRWQQDRASASPVEKPASRRPEPTHSEAQEIARLETQLLTINPIRQSPKLRQSIEARLDMLRRQIARRAL